MNNTQTSNVQHALLPIHIIKKDLNGSVLGQKDIHFQINAGNTYNISYKFFMPKGFHLASNTAPEVNCRLVNNQLNIPSVTFTYVKNGTPTQQHGQPVTVRYVNSNNGQQISRQTVSGRFGQNINVLQRVPLPAGYHLLSGQKTNFVISNHVQTLNLLIKPNQNHNANQTAPVHHVHHVVHHVQSNSSNDGSLQQFQNDYQAHQRKLQKALLHRVQQRDLAFLKKVTVILIQDLGYHNVSGLKADQAHHKVIGHVQKTNNQSAYLRSRRYGNDRPVSVSEIRDFVTCVMDDGANKGIFITTSSFSSSAQQEAQRHHIQMINGRRLAQLMIKNGIGTRLQHLYKIVGVDPKFFN